MIKAKTYFPTMANVAFEFVMNSIRVCLVSFLIMKPNWVVILLTVFSATTLAKRRDRVVIRGTTLAPGFKRREAQC